MLALLGCVALMANAQSMPEGMQGSEEGVPLNSATTALGPLTTVHGIVKDASTGEPLPRALVLVNGQSGLGTLTDGDGHFELSGISPGPNVFQLTKPGFEDAGGATAVAVLRDLRGFSHNVFVTANTPALEFAMRPTNSIRGQVDLSTGDPADSNSVTLLARQIQNGRAVWQPRGSTRANADGSYHFSHLDEGDYVVVAEPAPEADIGGRPAPADPGREGPQHGYPKMYYSDARDFAAAAKIHVAGGDSAQANLALPLERLHLVRAAVLLPPGFRNSSDGPVQFEVLSSDGAELPYTTGYKAESHTVWAMLPDGNYTLRVSAFQQNRPTGPGMGMVKAAMPLVGQLNITVAGQPLTTLRIAVGAMASSSLQVSIARTVQGSRPGAGNQGMAFVAISQAGPLTDGMQTMFAQGAGPGTLDVVPAAPGRYWVHTTVADPTLCESSFTAGGANLAREPLVVGEGGSTAPLTLSLRDDCASLKLSLPSTPGLASGEEIGYTVYVVPDADSTTEARTITLRASSGGSFTFNALTPGSYHVYTFAAPVNLEYHNPDALAGLPSQAITLAPNANADLVLEVPGP